MKIRRKLISTFLFIFVLTVGVAKIVLDYQEQIIRNNSINQINAVQRSFQNIQDQDIRVLSSALKVFSNDQTIKNIYLDGNREKLYEYVSPLFERLKQEQGITHLYFISPDGRCFLRAHNKNIFGDLITRFTFWKARDTKKLAAGIELGKTAFALRVVLPYYNGNELIGYVEFGEEIDHFFDILKKGTNDEFILFVDKKYLDRDKWRSVNEVVGDSDSWNDFPHHVMISNEQNGLGNIRKYFSEEDLDYLGAGGEFLRDIFVGDLSFAYGGFQINDASDQYSGEVVALIDITKTVGIARKQKIMLTGAAILLFIAILGVGFFISNAISSPIRKLKNAAARIGEGQLDTEIIIKSKDEIGDLAKSFSQMTKDLKGTTISKNYLDSIIENISDFLFVMDLSGKIVTVNRSICHELGYCEDEIIGKSAYSLFFTSEEHASFLEEKIKTIIDDGGQVREEISCKTKNGQDIPTILSCAVIRDKNNNAINIVGTAKDITDRKKAEIDLNNAHETSIKANQELKELQNQFIQTEKMASIGHLASGIAHEINNPIGFVSSNMQALEGYIKSFMKLFQRVGQLKGSMENEDVGKVKLLIEEIKILEKEENFDFIMNDISNLVEESNMGLERVKKIVADLRFFARESSDEKKELVRIENIIENAITMVHNEIKYTCDLEKNYGELPEIQCYSQKMSQVFINLMINAAHAIQENGKIIVRTYRENTFACIDIEDNGYGIPEEKINKIFDPFFTTKEVGKGTGLGMSISYDIVKSHGGDILVESKVGKGTKMTVKLPLG